jgi:hypothetical protein
VIDFVRVPNKLGFFWLPPLGSEPRAEWVSAGVRFRCSAYRAAAMAAGAGACGARGQGYFCPGS